MNESNQPRRRVWVTIVGWIVLFLATYVAGYLVSVERADSLDIDGMRVRVEWVPAYPFAVCEFIFRPVHLIGRRIRAEYWKATFMRFDPNARDWSLEKSP